MLKTANQQHQFSSSITEMAKVSRNQRIDKEKNPKIKF